MIRALPTAAAALLLTAGCGWISFQRPMTDDELRLEREIRSFYGEARAAFASGNSQALASLCDSSLAGAASRSDVERWAEGFFAAHGHAGLKLANFEFDQLGYERAVVSLRYSVRTPDGRSALSGAETDTLVKKNGRWYLAAREPAP